jgi:RNA polymerase sigma-70 factor (ECF subfamily)
MTDVRSEADRLEQMAQLVAEHHQPVYRYAYRLTGAVQDAEDITQNVFLTAQQKIGQLRKMDSARNWLFAILRNGFLKDRQRRRPSLAGDLSLNMDLVPAATGNDEADHDQLQNVLNQLTDASRLVVVMFYFEGCSYREIAHRLETPIGTVMSRLARARDHLRSLLLEPGQENVRKRRPSAVAE